MSEHLEQSAFHEYLTRFGHVQRVTNFFSIPNAGMRSYGAANWLRKEGMMAGVPDYYVAHAAGNFHGLFLEFKYGDGKQTPHQVEWQVRLTLAGYAYAVARSCEEAKKVLFEYMGGIYVQSAPETRPRRPNRGRRIRAVPNTGVPADRSSHQD